MSTATTPGGALALLGITLDVGRLLARVQAFREEHPPGHEGCAVCDHLRRRDGDHYPAGPTDTLAALHVALWNFDNLLVEARAGLPFEDELTALGEEAGGPGGPEYRDMVRGVREYVARLDPLADPQFAALVGGADRLDVVAYSPAGVGLSLAQFHAAGADPRDCGAGCDHCAGDRRAEGGGP